MGILCQTLKYELQGRYSKYNQLLNVMRTKNKDKLKQYIAGLIVDNDDLECEITRISGSWRNTSNLMEDQCKQKEKKVEHLKNLYHDQLKQNEILKEKLIKHGIIQKEDINNDDHDDGEPTDDEMNALWNDGDDDDDNETESDSPF